MTLQPDIVIIGGGIAGLWTLAHLRSQGYSALLFESGALGEGQSINSQGILHGGLKYALSGRADTDALALAAMPTLWRTAFEGTGPLRICDRAVVSDYIHLWSSNRPGARLATFLASKALQGQVEKLAPAQYPKQLKLSAAGGAVYRVKEQVVDVPRLLEALVALNRAAIRTIDWQQARIDTARGSARLQLPGVELQPRQMLLAAGAGNADLLRTIGASAPHMQRRPLHQVMVRQPGWRPLFGHFLGAGTEPRLSITSHATGAGDTVWYIGGELATAGVDTAPEALIEQARTELARALPGWDDSAASWRTARLDRAEAAMDSGNKPDSSFLGAVPGIDNLQVAWPTKLVLAPQLAERVQQQLAGNPGPGFDLAALGTATLPPVAKPVWETLF